MSEAARKTRKKLSTVENELKHLTSAAVDTLIQRGLVPENAQASSWAIEIEIPGHVRFRYESGAEQTKPAAGTRQPEGPRKTVTVGQKGRIKALAAELGLTEVRIGSERYPLDAISIKALDALPGSLPRETASAIISTLEAMGR